MKKLTMIFSLLALWIPQSYAIVDKTVWETFLQQTVHFGYVCNEFFQIAESQEQETVSEAQKNALDIIRSNYESMMQQVKAAQHNNNVQQSVITSFGNDLLTMNQELGVRGYFYESMPTSIFSDDDLSTHMATIQQGLNRFESYCMGMFTKPLHRRMANVLAYNYITTHLIPNTINYVAAPALSLYLGWQLIKRFDATYGSAVCAIAPVPMGYLFAKALRDLQEEQFLKNQDRAFDQRALKEAEEQINILLPEALSAYQTNHKTILSIPAIQTAAQFLTDSASWWKSHNPGPQAILVHGAHTENVATTIAHNANVPIIALSFLDLSSTDRVKAVIKKAKTAASSHPNKAIIIAIDDIDCLPQNSNALLNITQKLLKCNPYLNLLIVGTAQDINRVPEALKNECQLIGI